MLIWAGIVEGFFSQYHAPVLPYEVKIGFGVIELGLLLCFFYFSGRKEVVPLTWARIRGRLAGRRRRTAKPFKRDEADS